MLLIRETEKMKEYQKILNEKQQKTCQELTNPKKAAIAVLK